MAGRRTSIFIQPGSMTSLERSPQESETHNFSFRDWHKRMQTEHELLEGLDGPASFRLWKCCYKGCKPCRWFDSIDYQKKICKCCLKFETFKTLGTTLLIACFIYLLMYSFLDKEVLPGGSVFFLLFLFFTAYVVGYIVMLAGFPPMIGNLVVGIIFGNVPPHLLPARDNKFIENVAQIGEKALLIIALIRAGLLLDLSRIKNRILFIVQISFFPFVFEFILVWITSHFLLKMPWDWSALQGSVIGIVSLASVTSVMEKNKISGYGENIHLSTVLIAASALNVVIGLVFFSVCVSYLFPEANKSDIWWPLLDILKQIAIGLGVGLLCGILVAFFPDKRNRDAAALRIIVIGTGSFAITCVLEHFNMQAAGAMGCLTLCIIATNMWEEIGWHQHNENKTNKKRRKNKKENGKNKVNFKSPAIAYGYVKNPVQYFYTLVYYIGHPVVLSLVGFTMHFRETQAKDVGLSFSIILIGLAGRGIMCFAVTTGKSYSTTAKEKLYICITWLCKGTFQALLAFTIKYIIIQKSTLGEENFEILLQYSECLRRTTILSILFTTPLVCFTLTFLTPKLLTKKIHNSSSKNDLTEPLTKKEESSKKGYK